MHSQRKHFVVALHGYDTTKDRFRRKQPIECGAGVTFRNEWLPSLAAWRDHYAMNNRARLRRYRYKIAHAKQFHRHFGKQQAIAGQQEWRHALSGDCKSHTAAGSKPLY